MILSLKSWLIIIILVRYAQIYHKSHINRFTTHFQYKTSAKCTTNEYSVFFQILTKKFGMRKVRLDRSHRTGQHFLATRVWTIKPTLKKHIYLVNAENMCLGQKKFLIRILSILYVSKKYDF